MDRGEGSTLGAALLAAITDAAGGATGVLGSYTAKGWHAQISKITSTPRGYEAAEKAGLSVTRETLMNWLSEKTEPRAGHRRQIAEAYEIMRGRWPAHIESKAIFITGEVRIASDRRDRGHGGQAPFVIDGSMAAPGRWSELRQRWEDQSVTLDWLELEWFQALIEDDLGEMSDPPDFPGAGYLVEIS